MATISARTRPELPNQVQLSAAQAGNGVSTNVADSGASTGPALLRISSAVGATPTVTVAIEGSMDGVNWYAVPYADSATPETTSVATFVITTATTVYKHLKPGYSWRYLRLTYSANTNVTLTADVWIF